MLTKVMKWIFTSLLVLAVLWPSPAGYEILLAAFAVCAGAVLVTQVSRAGKHFGKAGYAMVSREVKYENSDSAGSLPGRVSPTPCAPSASK